MRRLIWPGLMGAMTAYVWHHNTTESGSKLLFPFIDSLRPSLADDPVALGEASVWAFGILTAGFFVEAIVRIIQDRRTSSESQ